MNKFDFINNVYDNKISCRDYSKSFVFKFDSNSENKDVVSFSSKRGMIVKSEIQDNVGKQLKKMFKTVKDENEKLLYLKMNKETKDLFRVYFSYEVSYVPRNLTVADKQIGKIVGSILGFKIVQDDLLAINEVLPVVSSVVEEIVLGKNNSKMKNILN